MRVSIALVVFGALVAGCGGPAPVPAPCPAEFPQLPLTSDLLADAGPDFEAEVGDRIRFDASASFATNGAEFSYFWGQVLGPCGKLDLTDPAHPKVRVPPVHADEATLVFRLHLVQGDRMSAGDDAEIVVSQ